MLVGPDITGMDSARRALHPGRRHCHTVFRMYTRGFGRWQRSMSRRGDTYSGMQVESLEGAQRPRPVHVHPTSTHPVRHPNQTTSSSGTTQRPTLSFRKWLAMYPMTRFMLILQVAEVHCEPEKRRDARIVAPRGAGRLIVPRTHRLPDRYSPPSLVLVLGSKISLKSVGVS